MEISILKDGLVFKNRLKIKNQSSLVWREAYSHLLLMSVLYTKDKIIHQGPLIICQ